MDNKPKRVGEVRIKYLRSTGKSYTDGDVENELLSLFKTRGALNADELRQEININGSWAKTYHLSPVRKNLLNWYDFNPNASLLEVGSGCGALTGVFASRCKNVTSLELSERRALINAYRHKEFTNLSLVVGNIQDYSPKERFDYVACIGVLEYAGSFIDAPDPYDKLLSDLASLLKPNGVLILAIENKLGLKYWAGSKEDHTGEFFDSIHDYPGIDHVRTFAESELKMRLSAHFKDLDFYYPHPDYKFPLAIFSDRLMPGKDLEFPYSSLPVPAPDQDRVHTVSEQLAMRSIIKDGRFSDFANSFLVIAKKAPDTPSSKIVFARTQTQRKLALSTMTMVKKEGNSLKVYKEALNKKAATHLLKMPKTAKKLSRHLKPLGVNVAHPRIHSKQILRFEFIDGVSLEKLLFDALVEDEIVTATEIIDKVISVITKLPSKMLNPSNNAEYIKIFGNQFSQSQVCLLQGILDFNFDNFMVDKNSNLYLIDYEWVFAFPIPRNLVIARLFLYIFVLRFNESMRYLARKNPLSYLQIGPELFVPQRIYERYKKYFELLGPTKNAENSFQTYVAGIPQIANIDLYTEPVPVNTESLIPNTVYEALNVKARIKELTEKNKILDAGNSALQIELTSIKDSRTWKLFRRYSKIKQKLRGR